MTKTYTEEFKRDAVQLVETSGKRKTQVARELGVSETALDRWIKDYGAHPVSSLASNGSTVKELEAEVKRLRRERDILKKGISITSQDRR